MKDKRDVKTSDALDPAFRLLCDHNFLRPLDRDRGGRSGPAAEVYAVNPAWERTVPRN